ncbi:hypothetical protein [Bdellovibrio sp. NC01]|uniref:hypothetical protein n=1 Tax=Bdellovibrio sp. NC01 TaxID=2220073 RepID=UPI0011590806|nr:hypothetical protein [Bdellovibrio sp. NC01]QDK36712.1 hypothetical protein DOE51_03390 [Bdellovibrio sp. NC01]
MKRKVKVDSHRIPLVSELDIIESGQRQTESGEPEYFAKVAVPVPDIDESGKAVIIMATKDLKSDVALDKKGKGTFQVYVTAYPSGRFADFSIRIRKQIK